MLRKKWTANNEVTGSLLKFREKRKWQLALRRYVLTKNASGFYAPYFGLDIENYRKWIELQFIPNLSWQNFGTDWQFEHVVPLNFFDLSNADELYLCWNFINIRVECLRPYKDASRITLSAAKSYFESLNVNMQYSICLKMLKKIEKIEANNIIIQPNLSKFIGEKNAHLEKLTTLSAPEYLKVNQGVSLHDIYLEREILKNFG